MHIIKFAGRGGQGIVTAARILAMAHLNEGKYATSIGRFGAERRGAPLSVFLRSSDKPIKVKNFPSEFDSIIVSDPKLEIEDYIDNLKQKWTLVLNSNSQPNLSDFEIKPSKISTVDASRIAIELIAHSAIPITGTVMLSAFCKTTGLIRLESLIQAVREWFGKDIEVSERNIKAIRRGYEETKIISL